MLTVLTKIKKKKMAWSPLLQEVRDGSETNGDMLKDTGTSLKRLTLIESGTT